MRRQALGVRSPAQAGDHPIEVHTACTRPTQLFFLPARIAGCGAQGRAGAVRMEQGGLGDLFKQVSQNMKQMTDQRVGRASHIMLRPSDDAAAELLREWKAEIGDDEAKFQERARASSECRSAPRGGDLGFVTRGKLSPEFDEVIFEEEPGFVYGPLQTQFGYHLIYLHSCREPSGTGTLNAVRSRWPSP